MSRTTHREIHGGQRRLWAEAYGLSLDAVRDFSASINPLGPPQSVLRALQASPGDLLCHYPEEGSPLLRDALAARLGVLPGQVVITNGAAEALFLALAVLRPRRVLVLEPTFGEYRRLSLSQGAGVRVLQLKAENGFSLDFRELREALESIELIFLCNPSNPIGTTLPPEVLERVLTLCGALGSHLVVDESFMDFLPSFREATLVHQVSRRSGLTVVGSLTKFYALPGLRLGYLVTWAGLAREIESCRYPWSVSALAQALGLAALDDRQYPDITRGFVAEERERLARGLANLSGFETLPSETNFLLVRLGMGMKGSWLKHALANKGILIRDCTTFPGLGESYIRVAVRSRLENMALLEALGTLVNQSISTP